MSLIGQLLVELGINTAAFKEGLDKATYQAQQFGKQVSGSFQALENSVKGVGEAFAQLDPAIGGAIDGITSALGPLTGALGTVGGATVGVVTALVAAGVGAIGIAIHFSETAARLGELSQATGIAVEELSLLGNIAATKGIGVDQMAKALERMDKSALAAAQSGPKTANAYRDLGIAVTNADGSMRSAQEIFNDVSAKFATMPDGPLKTAEAIKIFGRAGAELIPLLNEGGAKIAELESHFKALNAVVSGPTAASAEQFKENTTLMGAAFTGIENQITADLLPALNEVAKEFIAAFEGGQDNIKGFVDAIAVVAKVLLNLGQVIALLAKLIVDAVGAGIEAFQQLGEVIRLVSGAIVNAARGDFKGAWLGLEEAGVGTWHRIKDNAALAIHDIESGVKGLANVWTAAAPAARKSTGTAASPQAGADTSFVDKQVSAMERQVIKEQELAEAVGKATASQIDANAAASAGAAIQKLVDEATEKGIQNTNKFKAALDAAIPRIKAAADFEASFKAIIADQSALDNFNRKIEEQTAAMLGDAAAGTAVEKQQAKNSAALLPLVANLTQLGLKYEELRVQYGDADPRVKALAADFQRQAEEVKAATDATAKLNAQVAANAGKSELSQQDAKLKAMQNVLLALQQGGEAYEKISTQVAEFAAKTGAADSVVQKFRADLIAENTAIQQQAAQKLATPGTSQQAQDLKIQIDYLNQQITAYKALGQSTTGYVQALSQVNAQYQDLLAKTGGFQQGATAAFADFAKNIQSTGQLMQKEITQGLDGISSNFAQMITTGKSSWQSLINSMEDALLKSSINTILNSLFKSISGALSGQGGFLGSLGSIFGGGHADGGDVTPGKTYLVGEKGPELLKVGAAGGSIVPNGQFGGGGGPSISVVQNISTPDVSGFKASQGQLHAAAYTKAGQQYARFHQ